MNITVKGVKAKEKTALENYVSKRAVKFYRLTKSISKVDVLLESKVARAGTEQDFEVIIHVHVPGKTETIRELDSDMYAAIDKATDRMIELLRRQKEKFVSKKFRRIKNFRDRFLSLFKR